MSTRGNKRRSKHGKRKNKTQTNDKRPKKPIIKEILPDLSKFDIFGIADDIWIDIICCLSFHELVSMKRVCKYFNQLYKSTQNINKMDNRFNVFWKNNCHQLCRNLSPNYTPQPNWHTFFWELRKFFINSELEHKFDAKKTLSKVEFNTICANQQFKTMEKWFKQFGNPKYQYYIGNLKNIKMIDDFRAFYWACRIDSIMMFQMLLSKPKYNNNILHVFDTNLNPLKLKKTYNFDFYQKYLSHYATFRRQGQYYADFVLHAHYGGIERVILQTSETILLTTLLKLIQVAVHQSDNSFIAPNKFSIQILRYLFQQFSDEIGTNALLYDITAPHRMKVSLLIDAIYFCGHDEIIRLLLAHPAMTKEMINFQLTPSVIFQKRHKIYKHWVSVEFSNAIDCICCVSPPKLINVKDYPKPDTILDLIRKSGYNVNTKTPSKGDTPLHSLCKLMMHKYFENIAKILLTAKDVVEKIDFNVKNNDGRTPLMILCGLSTEFDIIDIFEMLLSMEKLDINVQNNNGDSVLMMLCGPFGNFQCLKLLLTKRKDVDLLLSNNNNCNAFHSVADSGNLEKLQWFFAFIKEKLKNKKTIRNFINQQSGNTGDTPYVKACCATKYRKIGKNKKFLVELIHKCEVDVSIKSNSGYYARSYVKNANLKQWLRQQEEKSKYFKKEMKNAI